ncbi:hypothetical protein Moror_12025 [Moniliophthora roreri MCA 2997]|uniref:Uncharacterized protein n=2 Tax=Moniliophthora roreri TaxID=221103 RepID=V2WSZ0_MONRO|nr:hypothetical protein Moror_12025 [Moniliophthora roreri MCA 2997]
MTLPESTTQTSMDQISLSDLSVDIIALKTSTVVQFLLYGIYTVLFGICTHVLLNKKTKHYRYHFSAITFLFLLTSANVALSTASDMLFWCYSCSKHRARILMIAGYECAILSSAIADGILLWRCYVVWGKRWKIVALPFVVLLGGHVFGLTIVYDYLIAPLKSTLLAIFIGVNSLLLTMLLAFRIFKISREVTKYLGPKARSMYSLVLAAMMECGLLYTLLLTIYFSLAASLMQQGGTLFVGLNAADPRAKGITICVRALAPVAGINSTFIVVRVALGISLNDFESAMSSMRARTAIDQLDHPMFPDSNSSEYRDSLRADVDLRSI